MIMLVLGLFLGMSLVFMFFLASPTMEMDATVSNGKIVDGSIQLEDLPENYTGRVRVGVIVMDGKYSEEVLDPENLLELENRWRDNFVEREK